MTEINKIYTDLRSDVKTRNQAIRSLVNDLDFRNKVKAFILKKGGEHDDVTMVFNDSIVGLVKMVIKTKEFNQELYPYWMGIVKNLWFTQMTKNGKIPQAVEISEVEHQNFGGEASTPKLIMQGERGILIRKVLDKMRTNCKQVLLHWSAGYKMKEIADIVGYKSDSMARKKKSECIKQLFEYMAANPAIKSQLRSY